MMPEVYVTKRPLGREQACRCGEETGAEVVSSGGGSGATYVLVPGAWCSATIWDNVAQHLRGAGCDAVALTLTGLEPNTQADAAGIGLQDHVDEVLRHLTEQDLRDVVLVGHSYSGLVVGQVADRAPERVLRTAFVQAFLPVHGRSLLDAFGGDAAQELRQIEQDGGWWAPPTPEGLAQEPDLDEEQARALSLRLAPHRGRTVLEPVQMRRALTDLAATFVVQAGTVPVELRELPAGRLLPTTAGHFSMVTAPRELTDLLLSGT